MKLYVGNLSFNADKKSVEDLFSAHGTVTSVNIVTDRDTGRSRGFAFVEMENKKEAISAMNALSNHEFDGRALIVNEARPRVDRY